MSGIASVIGAFGASALKLNTTLSIVGMGLFTLASAILWKVAIIKRETA